MIPPELITFAAMFLGALAGGLLVAEYSIQRMKHEIAKITKIPLVKEMLKDEA